MKKILIIEYETSLLKAYQEMFKAEDVRVDIARTGQEGLNAIRLNKPDVILLDILLPGDINGLNVLQRLKFDIDTRNIPIIILTNLDSEEKFAKSLGAKDYLIKSNMTKDDIVKIAMDCLK